jgi:hypothetical protein
MNVPKRQLGIPRQFSNFCLSIAGRIDPYLSCSRIIIFPCCKSHIPLRNLLKVSHQMLEWYGISLWSAFISCTWNMNCLWFKHLAHIKFRSCTAVIVTSFILQTVLQHTPWWTIRWKNNIFQSGQLLYI